MNDRRARRARLTDAFGASAFAGVLLFAAACGAPTAAEPQRPLEPTDNTQNPATGDDAGVSTPTPTPPSGGGEVDDEGIDTGGCEAATLEAQRILESRCASCHGNGASMGGFSTVLDAAALVKERRIVTGDAAGSPLFRLVEAGAMPKGGPRLSATEVATLNTWISCGAPPPAGAGDAGVPGGDDAGLPPGGDDDDDDDGADDDDDGGNDDGNDNDDEADEDLDEAADMDEDLDEQAEEAGDG
jgi:hypothetical protein